MCTFQLAPLLRRHRDQTWQHFRSRGHKPTRQDNHAPPTTNSLSTHSSTLNSALYRNPSYTVKYVQFIKCLIIHIVQLIFICFLPDEFSLLCILTIIVILSELLFQEAKERKQILIFQIIVRSQSTFFKIIINQMFHNHLHYFANITLFIIC